MTSERHTWMLSIFSVTAIQYISVVQMPFYDLCGRNWIFDGQIHILHRISHFSTKISFMIFYRHFHTFLESCNAQNSKFKYLDQFAIWVIDIYVTISIVIDMFQWHLENKFTRLKRKNVELQFSSQIEFNVMLWASLGWQIEKVNKMVIESKSRIVIQIGATIYWKKALCIAFNIFE